MTWRIPRQKKDLDLLVSDEQTLQETLQVLAEKGFASAQMVESARYVRALRTNHQVNTLLTYREGNIYSGDILQIEQEPTEKGSAI